MIEYDLFKKCAFQFDAEKVHEWSVSSLKKYPSFGKLAFRQISSKHFSEGRYSLKVGKNHWSFPVGLAAGLDKNAEMLDFFEHSPFGAVEVGTVTPLPQLGNPRPRLFRHTKEETLQNALGFNNLGSEKIYTNIEKSLKSKTFTKVLGVNIGKNKSTPNELAINDYLQLFSHFFNLAHYIVVNISSPNTPNLRELQDTRWLKELFDELKKLNSKNIDIFVKVSPDLEESYLRKLLQFLLHETSVSGIVATNTSNQHVYGTGGISGRLLYPLAQKVRQIALEELKGSEVALIGVGGFSSYQEIKNFWQQGGRAVQVYSSFIFQGPELLRDIWSGIEFDLKQSGAKSLSEYLS